MKTFKQFLEEDGEGAVSSGQATGPANVVAGMAGLVGEPPVNMKKKKTPIITPTLTRKI